MADNPEEQSQDVDNPVKQGQFGLQKIYVKDISFETPNSPGIFKEQWNPAVNMDISHCRVN